MKKTLSIACAMAVPLLFSQSATAAFDYFKKSDDGFKRFSVSAGWLHAKPTGDATPVRNNTAIKEGTDAKNGSITAGEVKEVIDRNQSAEVLAKVDPVFGTDKMPGILPSNTDLSNVKFPLPLGDVSGNTVINGLGSFAIILPEN